MTAETSLLRYLATRTVAFILLTAVATGFLALPYLG